MIKPLLRSIPTMSGNVKLACTLLDYNKISKDLFETNIRGAHLYPLSSQLFQKSVKVSLLNSSYEYDLKRFYSAYSDTFYSPCFEYDKKDIKMLDRTSVVYTRNTDFEYGVKRISYQKSGCQFACFAPIYIDNVDDIPSYFLITVNIKSSKLTIKKQIRVNIGINGSSDYNYIYKYLKKYLSNIDDNVIYMDNTDKTLTYYGIDCINGGFTRTTDATVKNLFNIHMPIQMFDRTISIGFERNNMAIRQVIPLAFYFNVQDILTDSEKVKLRYADITFSGAYYDMNGNELKWHDFDWNYTKFSNDIYNMNQLNGIMQKSAGYTDNIMEVGFPGLSDKYLVQYQLANKLTTTFSKWKLKYSSDEWPYITNMSWAYSNNQDSTYKYREFPVTFTNQAGYAIIDENNKYNLRFPLGKDVELYNSFNTRSAKKYEAIMNNYCLNWFDLYYPENRMDDITDAIKRDKDQIEWVDVNNGYSYYKGVLYNFNLIYDKVSQFNEADKIDKFAMIVHPDTMNIINDDKKDKITFTSMTILTKELNNTEQILNNCIFNKQILDSIGTDTDEYIPLFDIYTANKTDNLMFNEIFEAVDKDNIDTEFIGNEPIFINSNDLLLDIYKSNSLIKPSEYAGIYKLSTLKDIPSKSGVRDITIETVDEFGTIKVENTTTEIDETYFGYNFINALILIFNTYDTVEGNEIVTKYINKINLVPDDILFKIDDSNNKLIYVENTGNSSMLSAADKANLSKIARRLFYSDEKGRTVLDLISDCYLEGVNKTPTIKQKKVDLFNGSFPIGATDINMFSAYSYFSQGPEGYTIENNPNVSIVHRDNRYFNGDPVNLLLAVAHGVSEAMKMNRTDESFKACFPVLFTEFGYDMWELLPIFRGDGFTNNDGSILSSIKDVIRQYTDINDNQYDHLIKDIYINYDKYHSFNPEKLIYKSGESIVIDDIKYQELLNNTYGHTLYYKSKFIDDTFLDNESFTVVNKFLMPLCISESKFFPYGNISIVETSTNTLYHAIARVMQLIKAYLYDKINDTALTDRFFYYPARYYNNYNVGTNVVYKINSNWNELTNNTVYADDMDNNVLYVHPYNFAKIKNFTNGITGGASTIVISTDDQGIQLKESDKVEFFGKVYNELHLDILLNMVQSDFEYILGTETDENGQQVQIKETIGTASDTRFYEQHKRLVLDSNTGYFKVKYEYIPIDFNKTYIIQKLDSENSIARINQQLAVYIDGFNENGEIIYKESSYIYDPVSEQYTSVVKPDVVESVNELLETLSSFYTELPYKSIISYDHTKGMFKRNKVCTEHPDDNVHSHILNYLLYKITNANGDVVFKQIYMHDTKTSMPGKDHVAVFNGEFVYEYFNIVEKNTFIKINNSIKEYINVNNPNEYNDMYIYRPILDLEYDEKYSNTAKCEAIIKDLSIPDNNLTDTSTMLYPCFNSVYKQELNATVFKLNIAVDNIRNVNLINLSNLPAANTYSSFRSSDLSISDSYYRYVLKDNALFISVTPDEYNALCNKILNYDFIEYDETTNTPKYQYIIWETMTGAPVANIDKYIMYESTDETFINYDAANERPLLNGINKFYYVSYDPDMPTGNYSNTDMESNVSSNGLIYRIKGDPIYKTINMDKQIPLKFSNVYKRRYIKNPVSLYSNSTNNIYRDNNLNVFTDNGTVYGYYLINTIIDNSSNSLNIKATLDMNESIVSYSDIDTISNINYVSIINDVDITQHPDYILKVFKQLCPFMYNNITGVMLNLNTIMRPETFNITNTYTTAKVNPINGSDELNLIYTKQTIMSAKKQILQRYTNSIVPFIYECNFVKDMYNLKLKECNATLLDSGEYLSIGDSPMYYESRFIDSFYGYNIYGVSTNPYIKDYNNIADTYIPLEYKFYNNSKLLNLETSIELTSASRFTYDELLNAESDNATLNVFRKYLKRLGLQLDNDEILFLYNKYDKKYENTSVGMSIDNSQKLYKLTYKFNLL